MMSFSFGSFDAREVEPAVGLSDKPVPAGKYRAQIVKGEWKENKKKNGRYLELVFEIVKGDHSGRRVWGRLNLENPSSQAVEIANGELSAICHAVGVMKPRNEQQLFNIPMVIGVEVEERKDSPWAYSNRIKTYESIEKSSASKPKQRETVPADDDDDPFS
jgi:hypothetical protein